MVLPAVKPPRSYYKRRTPPPAVRLQQDQKFVATLAANLGSIGPDRNKGISNLRKILLQDMATSIVNSTREAHINFTMGRWRTVRSQGHLNEEVAIVVDGSPQRPVKNVKFAGQIDVIAPASVATMIEAAEFAWNFMLKLSNAYRGDTSGDMVKKGWAGRPYRYHKSFEMFVSDKRQVSSISELRQDGAFGPYDWVSIHNYAPYAAKLERYRYPAGVYVQVFKRLRAKYGNQLAIRFDYVEGSTSMKQAKGAPTPQPVIRIGQAGAFPSRAPNIKKFIRDNAKRGNPY